MSKSPLTDALRQACVDSKMSVRSLAKAAGIAQPMLHKFMVDKKSLTLRSADKLAVYLKLRLVPQDSKAKKGQRK